MAPDEFLRACRERDLTGLVHERVCGMRGHCAWPRDVCDVLASEMRAQTANELLLRSELVSVLSALAAESISPILLKGTGLAYSLYGSATSRPRVDTDLLIHRSDVGRVRRVMGRRGYTAPLHSGGDLLFCQFPLRKTEPCGFVHAFDFHWKISTQSVFADVLTFDELAALAVAVPALGPNARTPAPLHALLLACIHPVMHHRNIEWPLWTYDVHLLASRLSAPDFDSFADLAIAKRVSAVCAHQLRCARRWFDTHIPESVMIAFAAVDEREPSAAYLRPDRQWRDELMSSLRGLPRWSDRLRLLRDVALPGPRYMLKAYGFTPSSFTAALLPVLYLHRLSSGGWKALSGQK
jgi:Uncharacterised nucleotidyltransferase